MPLGTAGSVKNAEELLGERFIVISGDALTDFDLTAVIAEHERRGAMATIVLKHVENPLDFGVVVVNDEGRVERFLEKPTWGQVFSDTVNTGIYVLEPEVFDYIPADQSYDFSQELFPKLFELGKPLYGTIAEGYWQDIGSLSQYLAANRDVLDGRVSDLDPRHQAREQRLHRREREHRVARTRDRAGRDRQLREDRPQRADRRLHGHGQQRRGQGPRRDALQRDRRQHLHRLGYQGLRRDHRQELRREAGRDPERGRRRGRRVRDR